MKIEVKKPTLIEEGKHTGKITKIEYRSEPYNYTDVYVKLDDCDIELKAGYPTVISEQSGLGKLLMSFGIELVVGKKIDPTEVLVGKRCEFLTMNEEKDGVTYARIVKGSIKPTAEEKKKADAQAFL